MIAHKRTQSALLVLALGLVPSSCTYILPKTSGLEQVHEIYAEEFAQLMVPDPPSGDADLSDKAKPVQESPFQRTLVAIREYRAEYGDSREAAHLLVLKGMVYLQSGQPGLAKLLADDVEQARGQLISGTGSETRDSLFAANFGSLTAGWSEIWKEFDGVDTTFTSRKNLEKAADAIAANLAALDDSQIANPAVDSGAVYVATSAAIFWMWAFTVGRSTRDPDAAPGSPAPFKSNAAEKRKEFAKKGAQLIRRFLSEEERQLIDSGGSLTEFAAQQSGRMRYVAWYDYLRRLAAQS